MIAVFSYIFFQFWEILSQTGVSLILRNSIELLLKTLGEEIFFLTCFTKIIAEQLFVIQYAWPMYHMKEK